MFVRQERDDFRTNSQEFVYSEVLEQSSQEWTDVNYCQIQNLINSTETAQLRGKIYLVSRIKVID